MKRSNRIQTEISEMLTPFIGQRVDCQTKCRVGDALTSFICQKIVNGQLRDVSYVVDINFERRLPFVERKLSGVTTLIDKALLLLELEDMREKLRDVNCLHVAVLDPVTLTPIPLEAVDV